MAYKKDMSGQKISYDQLNLAALVAIEEIYGTYLEKNTLLGPVTSKRAQISGAWNIQPTSFLEFTFTNPNYFDVYRQEYGIKAKIIRANKKKFMRFKKPISRKSTYRKIPGNIAFESQGYIYAKAIRHPGFKARQFIKKMMLDKKLLNDFQNELEKNIKKMIINKMENALKD